MIHIYICWVESASVVVSDDGFDIGRPRSTKLVDDPKAALWIWKGSDKDIQSAISYGSSEGYSVVCVKERRCHKEAKRKARELIIKTPSAQLIKE